jgi:predicted nucleic acid-binding protein
MSNSEEAKKELIILDTNILQYIQHDKFSSQLGSFLHELFNMTYELSVSNISIYELLCGTSLNLEKRGTEVLSWFTQLDVSKDVLLLSSQLFTLYNDQKISKEQISYADRIIAATCVLTNSLLLTGDVNDFPRPFFTEVYEEKIFYKQKNKTCLQVVQLLQPNHEFILQKLSERV